MSVFMGEMDSKTLICPDWQTFECMAQSPEVLGWCTPLLRGRSVSDLGRTADIIQLLQGFKDVGCNHRATNCYVSTEA